MNNNKYDCMDAGGTGEPESCPERRSRATHGAVAIPPSIQAGIKMVRYRLSVGCKHQVTSEEIKKVLIEESGVDKNNIKIINIQGDYTLVELPDEMPQDIFLHLKMVEIKQHKLDIKRVKVRSKKRGNHYNRRGRSRALSSDNSGSNQVSGG
ncbi:MAG: DbpA RNA binding domain-containing protein [Methylococcaceae bacterium]